MSQIITLQPQPRRSTLTDPGEGNAIDGSIDISVSGILNDANQAEAPKPPQPFLTVNGVERIGKYYLIRQRGSGGGGDVIQAHDCELNRKCALKLLRVDASETERKRFLSEAQMVARCVHENIVRVHGHGELKELGGRPFIDYELIDGVPLSDWIAAGKPIPVARALEVIIRVAMALECAHGHGVIHRDVKPSNVLITEDGRVVLVDFGIAKVMKKPQPPIPPLPTLKHLRPGLLDLVTDDFTQSGTFVGTYPYMAPEQWLTLPLDYRVDVFALGIMLYMFLAARHPLGNRRGIEFQVMADLDVPLPPLRSVASYVPPEVAAIVDRAIKKRREDRFQTVREMREAMARCLEGLPGRALRELKADESPYPGLAPFVEQDADKLFGRAEEIRAFAHRLHSQALMAVASPSGGGKSSFVAAGVVPALKRSGELWEVITLRPGRHPLGALARALEALDDNGTRTRTVNDSVTAERSLAGRLLVEHRLAGSMVQAWARRAGVNALVFVDQAEELFSLGAASAERGAFLSALLSIGDDPNLPARVVVAIRSDFLERLSEAPPFLAELTKGLVFLRGLTKEGLREAVEQPALRAGYQFEPGIVDEMVRYLESAPEAAAPSILQFTAAQLFVGRDAVRRLLTRNAYDGLGGVAGALARYADEVVAQLPPAMRALVPELFSRLVTAEGTRAVLDLDELSGGLLKLAERLWHARLLLVQQPNVGRPTVELVHEALIVQWPTLQRLIASNGQAIAFLEQTRVAAKQWAHNNRDPDLLWRGDLAEEARHFVARYRGDIPAQSRDFITAVLAEVDRGKRRKRRWALLGVGALATVTAGALVAVFLISISQIKALRSAASERAAKEEAQRQTRVANDFAAAERKAKEEAQKERDARAEAQKKAETYAEALTEKTAALTQALTQSEKLTSALKTKTSELSRALSQTERARASEQKARVKAQVAVRARDEALRNERARSKDLENQLGGKARLREMEWGSGEGER